MIDVSIIIVCMNNLNNLNPCLDSIRKYTTVSYETLVVAYLFTNENLEKLKTDYPWVAIIESNEIRGFSENNNLALRQAKGKYCFVLNDDTKMEMAVIDNLVSTFNRLPKDVAIVSPKLIYGDGTTQYCGRPPINWKTYILSQIGLWNEKRIQSKYHNQKGIFQTYNIAGSCFMIKTEVFKKVGFFDEYYFFCPEDIAVSTELNRRGYKCFVNEDVCITHFEGGSGISNLNIIKAAISPAGEKGTIRFLANNNQLIYVSLSIFTFFLSIFKAIYHSSLSNRCDDNNDIISRAYKNIAFSILRNNTPKAIFQKYYNTRTK